MLKISRLTVEHLATGCVTDCEHPRVSFQLESDRENVMLDHAVIRIGDWSVETKDQILIPYEGKQLLPFTTYTVHVHTIWFDMLRGSHIHPYRTVYTCTGIPAAVRLVCMCYNAKL